MTTPSTPINILCARFYPDKHGGVEERMFNVSHEFSQLGHTTNIFTENRCNAAPHEDLNPHLHVHRLDPLNIGRLWRFQTMLRLNWWRKNIKQHVKHGFIWATDPLMAVAAISLGRSRDVIYNPACCVQAMGQITKAYPTVDTFILPKSLAMVDKLAWRKAKRVIISSQNMLQQMTRQYGPRNNTHIIPHGVSDNRQSKTQNHTQPQQTQQNLKKQFGIYPDTFTLGFVGRLDPCKDLPFAFKALQQLKASNNTVLMIVGTGSDHQRLSWLAQLMGIQHRILYLGHMDNPAPAYQAMDALILPSVYESFGNVILEAMHNARPVIARQFHANPSQPVWTASQELIQHGKNGWLVDAQNPNNLTQLIERLSANPAEIQQAGQHARQTTRQMKWSDTINQYTQILNLTPPQQPLRAAA